MENKRLSVFISLVLRHKPEAAYIELDPHGWADVEQLIRGVNQTGRKMDRQDLEEIVATSNKQRYSFNADKTKIRANQGHSIAVDVELKEQTPPEVLYHGTARHLLEAILREGLRPMTRLYVHLSADAQTAVNVGSRHGEPVVLTIDTRKMSEDGIPFFLSENGVWLTKAVPAAYIRRPQA